MKNICKYLAGAALALSGYAVQAQGLEGIIVEDYYTISAADADYLNNTVGVTYPINAGAHVYRIYVDMAPNYKLNTVSGSPLPQGGGNSPNPLDFTTTTTFWNEDGFGTEVPPQTARFDDGAAFDSYITIGTTGRSGGAAGCGLNTQHVGTLRTADTNGNLTLCAVYSGFPNAATNDGNIPGTVPALTYNLGGLIDFAALQADGDQLVVVGDAWATLPNGPGVDPTGTNRVLIAQLTTDGDLSFHINVQLQQPTGGVLESYVWQTAGAGEVVSPFLTYPAAGVPDCLGVIGGPALPGTACNDNNVCTTNDLWSAQCVCTGTPNTTDTDADGTPDCSDNCPNVAGQQGSACNDNNVCTTGDVLNASCQCVGTPNNTDTDGDGIPNCSDNCPNVTGQQGSACNDNNVCTTNDVLNASCVCVGTPDNTDSDGDGVPNCSDNCPNVAGQQGSACNDNNACTINDVLSANCVCAGTFQDTDGDGICNANDNCPNLAGVQGDACNDGNASTSNDVITVNCVCAGTQPNDCLGVPGGPAQPGTACNDGNSATGNDTWSAGCVCIGQLIDCLGVPGGTALVGSVCNDNNACTINDVYQANCSCAGTNQDTDGDGICDANDNCPNLAGVQGDACNDGNASTSNDVITANCVCAGTQANDCLGVPGGPAQPGTACNDNNPNTGNDTWSANCVCIGQTLDCLGVPGGTATTGSACNDGSACTTGDVYNADCICAGTFQDTDGDGVCNANDNCPNLTGVQGDACNDGNANTSNDVITPNCECVGTTVGTDCLGIPGGTALPGTACNDNNANTGNDTWSASCVCEGQLLDCLGVPGGTATIGSSCNDDNACTTDDVYNADCLCVGAFQDTDGDGVCNANDNCPNVTGQIGSACNDNNESTTNDVLNANCQCQGTPVGGCTENLTLSITLDANGSQTSWTLYDATETGILDAGGPYANGTPGVVITEEICVPVGCYHLRFSDSGNDGITGGGYVLRNAASKRIIDASVGSFTTTSEIGGTSARTFCVPIGALQILNNWCDRTNLLITSPIYCNSQPGASGYQWWIYNPHGTYNRRVTTTTNILAPVNLNTNPIPTNTFLNIRVRPVIGGNPSGEFGPACRVRFVPNGGSGRELVLDEETSVTMSIFPNPNRDGLVTLTMEGLAIENETPVNVEVYDMVGQRVHAESAIAAEGTLNHRMDLSATIGAGLYMVNVTIDGQLYTQRLVVQ